MIDPFERPVFELVLTPKIQPLGRDLTPFRKDVLPGAFQEVAQLFRSAFTPFGSLTDPFDVNFADEEDGDLADVVAAFLIHSGRGGGADQVSYFAAAIAKRVFSYPDGSGLMLDKGQIRFETPTSSTIIEMNVLGYVEYRYKLRVRFGEHGSSNRAAAIIHACKQAGIMTEAVYVDKPTST
jgi:hypothetical protein